MEVIDSLLQNPLIALFAVVGLGLALGNIKVAGLSLGTSGVLFVALLFGHLHYELPNLIGNIGLVIFVYCVGIGAGGRFFSSLANEGVTFAKLACIIVGLGGAMAWGATQFLDIPAPLSTGIFAGALTSTPALAAATEATTSSDVIVGYGIAYPFGVIGVVLFVQLMPRILKLDLDKIDREQASKNDEGNEVVNVLVEVTNPNIFGQRLNRSEMVNIDGCQISRIMDEAEEKLRPLKYDDTFEEGHYILLVGRQKTIQLAIDYIGKVSDRSYTKDVENERAQLVVTKKECSKRLGSLHTLKNFGVTVTRITRMGQTIIPTRETVVQVNDVLRTVGTPDGIDAFGKSIGHRSQAFEQTDLLSICAGIVMGIILGMIPFGLPGSSGITLGLAGGPLIMALILGHFGQIGRIRGHIPRPTRMLLQDLGLVFFLANAGVKGGDKMAETLAAQGPMLLFVGIAITTVPMLLAYPLATKLFKLNPLQALGGICGGMTSTPALGALTSRTTSNIPVVSYATIYPVALIVMTLLAKFLVEL
ncbi:aspartate:alanine exchanger family transporter [Persicirhabdus sediminis]|uniref:YidE/YbjL duplication n=1 Tax=Persicirhabdus sediminis TaxID=454144 RepID=A0A8J7SLL9_9BACT|nr:TrkA C-terminal domain-containing protein [Persicirhabdus sediminis]MBK1792446.1 YidE/YbjL duplication [Persicirhabdus sediminis]